MIPFHSWVYISEKVKAANQKDTCIPMYTMEYYSTIKKEISELLYLCILGLNNYEFGENAIEVPCLCHLIISRGR